MLNFVLMRSAFCRGVGYSWSGVYACQPKPHRGWVLNLILSLLSREVNVPLLHRHYFEREASYLSHRETVGLP